MPKRTIPKINYLQNILQIAGIPKGYIEIQKPGYSADSGYMSIPALSWPRPRVITGSSRLAASPQCSCQAQTLEIKRATLSQCLNKRTLGGGICYEIHSPKLLHGSGGGDAKPVGKV
jgi:hypothetical protein